MDAFESVVAALLVRQGYWVQTSVKVELTKEQKRVIGRHSSPRWELDIVGYRGRDNKLLVLECKSYLDSGGVNYKDICGPTAHPRYKLFTEPVLRSVVLDRLKEQFVAAGFCANDPKIELGLAAGKIRSSDLEQIHAHFKSQGWALWDNDYLKRELNELSKSRYENTVAAVVSKLLLR
jgi:hypothetical protein